MESPEDVMELLAPLAARLAGDLRTRLEAPISEPGSPPGTGSGASPAAHPPGDPDHKRLWQALGHDPTDMDQLVARTGLTPARLSSILLLMELEGRVEAQHGRYYRSR